MPRSPKGRAAARGLDARLSLQHAFMPAGDASLENIELWKLIKSWRVAKLVER
jgi:hypothetical protein